MIAKGTRKSEPPTMAGGALDVEYVGQIDGSSYDEHLRSPAVQAVIASARSSWRSLYGNDPDADRIGSAS